METGIIFLLVCLGLCVRGLPVNDKEILSSSCIEMTPEREQEIHKIVEEVNNFIETLSDKHEDIDFTLVKLVIEKHSDDEHDEKETVLKIVINDCKRAGTETRKANYLENNFDSHDDSNLSEEISSEENTEYSDNKSIENYSSNLVNSESLKESGRNLKVKEKRNEINENDKNVQDTIASSKDVSVDESSKDTIASSKDVSVDESSKYTIASSKDVSVDESSKYTIASSKDVSVDESSKDTIASSKDVSVDESSKYTIASSKDVSVDESSKDTIASSKDVSVDESSKYTIASSKDVSVDESSKYTIASSKDVSVDESSKDTIASSKDVSVDESSKDKNVKNDSINKTTRQQLRDDIIETLIKDLEELNEKQLPNDSDNGVFIFAPTIDNSKVELNNHYDDLLKDIYKTAIQKLARLETELENIKKAQIDNRLSNINDLFNKFDRNSMNPYYSFQRNLFDNYANGLRRNSVYGNTGLELIYF